MPGTTKKVIQTSPDKSKLAAGGTLESFQTKDMHQTAFRWRRRPAAANHCSSSEILEGGESSSSKSIECPNSDDRGIGIFGRISGAPADRNLIDLYADAGVEFIGLSDKRPDDKLGIAAGYAHISKRAQQLDADYRTFVSPTWPQRSFEGLVTAVYQYQVRDGWTVQPNFQYIIHPGGGATLPSGPFPGRPLKNAAVLGLRTTLKF